ncbi:MAG: AAA family ATPase [Thermoleophilaceae bacterium]
MATSPEHLRPSNGLSPAADGELFGRDRETEMVGTLLESVRERGAALVLTGEPGIGKSALLDDAEGRALGLGMTVLRTAGVPSESQMAFAGLHKLLSRHIDAISELPGPQAAALSSAFGLTGDAAPDLFLIALAALELLADAAADAPLVLIVEDAHWLDADSCQVLAFIARRLELEPVALLFAVRDGPASALDEARLPELRLTGLDETESARLLDSHAPGLTQELRRGVLDAARGNPLALLELPRVMASTTVDRSLPRTPLPLTDALEGAFSERLSALSETSGSVLLVAAVDDGGSLNEILEAASVLEGRRVTAGELEPAEETGLVRLEDTGVHFRHPLVRAAIYRAATTSARQAAHAALADAHAVDPDRSVWHRAASLAGADAQVASELDAAAARALRRGAPAVAAAALQRAAQLTADPAARGGRLLHAAEMEFELGRPDLALRLLAQAKPLDLSEVERARLTLLVEAADEDSWSGPARVASFAEIASRMASAEQPERALIPLLTVARSCWWGNPTQETRDLVVATATRLDVPEDSPAVLAVLGVTDPVKCGAHVIDRISRIAPDSGTDPAAMHLLGTVATTVWAFDLSLRFLGAAVDDLRAQGRLGLLAQALVSQAFAALHCASGTLAVSAADEAARLARETGQSRWALAAELVQATVAAERGDFETADALANRAEAELLPIGAQAMLALVQFARGRGAVVHQSYPDAFDHLKRALDPSDVGYHPFVGSWALADLIEAAARIGKGDEAEAYLEQLEFLTAATSGPFLRAQLAYARPLLASDDEAGALYQAALSSDLSSWPSYRGRVLLAYGGWLRRQRRVAESRAPLRAARDTFDALAFDGLAERAREELRASGEASRRRAPDARDQLTPQELQIAQLTADGLSNREIGQRLYLSHRTVGSHLYRIFPKLGVVSRGQLAEALWHGHHATPG